MSKYIFNNKIWPRKRKQAFGLRHYQVSPFFEKSHPPVIFTVLGDEDIRYMPHHSYETAHHKTT